MTAAAVIVMGATCTGLVEEVDALGGDVHGTVEEKHSHRCLLYHYDAADE